MGKNETKSFIVSVILTIAVGCMLAVSGIYALQGKSADMAVKGLRSIFDGNAENIVVIVFGVIELVAGVFVVIKCFVGNLPFSKVLSLIVIIVWLAVIILSDILGGIGKPDFLAWLLHLSKDLIIFCAILITN